jgi:cytochrome c biogenesis protein CcdA
MVSLFPIDGWLSSILTAVSPVISQSPVFLYPLGGLFLGVLTGLSPCSLSIAPLWLGVLLAEKTPEHCPLTTQTTQCYKAIATKTLAFVLGLATVYGILGILVFQLRILIFGAWQNQWLFIGLGIITLLLGIQIVGVFQLPLPTKLLELVHQLQQMAQKTGRWKAYLLGVAYSFLLSPCGTPLLTATGTLAVHSKSVVLTAFILACYGAGQGMVLFLLALGIGWLKNRQHLRQWGEHLNQLGGWILVLLGVYLVWQGVLLYYKP